MPRRPGQILLGGTVIAIAVSMVVDMPWLFSSPLSGLLLWSFFWFLFSFGLFLLVWGVAPAAVIRGVAVLPGGARMNRMLNKVDLWIADATDGGEL